MVVGEMPESVDLLVVGGGPGGYTAALHAARAGRDVVLVDRAGAAGLGGVCLHHGCIPSKALIEVAGRVTAAAEFEESGLTPGSVGFDMARFQSWKNDTVEGLRRGVDGLLGRAKVRVVAGDLRFTRPTQAVIETPEGQATFLEFAHAVVATGSRPVDLPDMPRDGERVLDSADLLALTSLPDSLVVVGGGYIGVELSTACAKLGSRVTIVEADERLLPAMDAKLSRPLGSRLEALGIEVLTDSTVDGLDADGVLVHTPDGPRHVEAATVVTAVGRRPNTDSLGLDTADVKLDDAGRIEVGDDRRATPTIAAIGDVTSGHALAHKATAEAAVAVDALAGRPAAFAPQGVPAVVFGDPEVASAGLSTAEAGARGMDVGSVTFPLTASGRAATMRAATGGGFAELVYERGDGGVVGVHLVGPHASELIGEGVLAIEMGATVEDVSLSIHPHPTLSEQLYEAAHLGVSRTGSHVDARD